jgi:hypothetical protein
MTTLGFFHWLGGKGAQVHDPTLNSFFVGWCPSNLWMGLLSTVDPGWVYFDLQLWSSLPKQDAQFRRADAVGIPEVVVEEASSEGVRLH